MKYLKPGAKIHIKKANRGKFTEYCGGKVTNECIQRGKSSPNPAIRKRATFAANARKWSHAKGGAFRYGVNVLDSDPRAYKHVKKKYRMHLSGGSFDWGSAVKGIGSAVVSGISAALLNKAINTQINNLNQQKKQKSKSLFADAYDKELKELTDNAEKLRQFYNESGITVNMNPDILRSIAYKNANGKVDRTFLDELDNQITGLEQTKLENTNNIISGIGNSLVGVVSLYGNYLSSKNAAPSTVDTNALDKLNNWSNSLMEALKKQQLLNLFASGNAYLQSKYSTR